MLISRAWCRKAWISERTELEISLSEVFRAILARDLRVAWRRKADVLTTLFFFVIVVSLFPLGVGPEKDTLREIAPGVVWVAALLAAMMSLARMFASDFADGSLEQMLLAPFPLGVLVLAKVAAHWLSTGLPLVLVAPVLGLQFDLPSDAIRTLMGSLLIGTAALSLIGAIGAALTLGVRGAGALVALLVLPLYIPILIFGAGAVVAAVNGMDTSGHFSLLGAMLMVAAVISPLATSAALRIALE
jgi:heme exporter protein B